MGEGNGLREYRGRRDFGRTGEPAGRGEPGEGPTGGRPRFVVQIHDARTLHFDFRLQVADVLKSWSVPKGPSADPGDKRLAMPTEDHPLEYEGFEGVVPAGEYGGGTVIVWDHGTYDPLSHDREGRPVDFARALGRGHVRFRLHGAKLRGEYALTRFRGGRDRDEREAWLLVKTAGGASRGRGTPDPRRARSALTGRTLARVAEEERGTGSGVTAGPSRPRRGG
ncbi:DNA polymerase ligase N-terminal domain-containing protein [Streptomyces sp. NPDC047725]|uniref:DNA polymerase ligase N-terminal domain-containing protein n=1 Tax=Streptomyces sp. NPDC047725 TaxID=3365487 RepID=UPI0037167709